MVMRLLVVVLTLVGPLPFRVCTCAATATACTDTDRHAAPTGEEACPCGHSHHGTDDEAGANPTVASDEDGHTHPPAHEPGCPCAEFRPAADAAAPTEARHTTSHGSPDNIATVPDSLLSAGRVTRSPLPVPRAPSRPLFLTLLTLRN